MSIRRRGKHILIELSNGLTLHVHLRMTGNLRVVPDIRLRLASTRAYFEFENARGLFFDDPRALGKIHLRTAERRLDAVRRTLAADDRPPLEDAQKKLERFRQDLLNAMFTDPKKEKKP